MLELESRPRRPANFLGATRAAALLVLAGLAPLAACDRLTPPPAHEQVKVEAPAAQPAAAAKPAAAPRSPAPAFGPGELPVQGDRFPAAPRLVAIGDLHGDIGATRRALRLAGAIDQSDRWIGGELVVVQTGDQLDRGDDEQAILELLAAVQREAAAAGGALHILNGNHEFMNALGDLRYVTPGGMADFADAPGVDPSAPELAPILAKVPTQARSRVAAFWPGQPWAREFGKRNVIVVIGESVFVHGGVTPAWAGQISEINEQSRAWFKGARSEPPAAVVDNDGPVWSRHYSDDPGPPECAMLEQALATIGAKRMIVAHTVHTEGIRSACAEQVWMIDVGMAAHYRGPVEVLEIRGEQITALRE